MKSRYLILNTIEATSLQLAFIRSELKGLDVIEIDNTFYVSCTPSLKDKLSKKLNENNIKYILVFVYHKSGGAVLENGNNPNDKKALENIINDQ